MYIPKPSEKLDNRALESLTNLTSLSIQVEHRHGVDWLSRLPSGLRNLSLEVPATQKHRGSYRQCLPHFTRLHELQALRLRLVGALTSTSLHLLVDLPLHTLNVGSPQYGRPLCLQDSKNQARYVRLALDSRLSSVSVSLAMTFGNAWGVILVQKTSITGC